MSVLLISLKCFHAHCGAMGSIHLCYPLGIISSESGVQQGDPLLFLLVIHRVVSALASNCPELLFHMCILMMVPVLHALSIVQDHGPPNGLFLNTSKCE